MPAIDQTDLQVQRDIGSLMAEMRILTDKVSSLSEKLDDVHDALEQAKGGWRMVAALGTVSGAIGGVAAMLAKIKFAG